MVTHVQQFARSARKVAVVLTVTAVAVGTAACGSSGDDSDAGSGSGGDRGPIVVASWGGRYEEATRRFLLEPFTRETGIETRIVAAPGTQVASLQAQRQTSNPQWDVMDSLTGEDAAFLDDNDLLEPLPADLRAVIERNAPEGSVTDYGIPYGNLGHIVVCNMDRVRRCPESAAEFFDVDAFPGTRTMSGNHPLVAYTLAQMADGVPAGETADTDIDLDRAVAALERVKPSVKVFWKSGDQMEQLIQTGEVDMGILYSGRAQGLIDNQGMNLRLNWNEGVYNPGVTAVVKGSKHAEAGFELIRWIAEHPEAQARWAEFMAYSVPNPRAIGMLPRAVAGVLADEPDNYRLLGKENFGWYVEHHRAANDAFRELVGG